MTRLKKGMDYFPFTTDQFQNLPMKRLRRELRNDGLLVYIYLLNEVYRMEGYYLHVDDELLLDTSEYFFLNEKKVSHIIQVCCREGLFDEKLYKKYGILTSADIQERYVTFCIKLRRAHIELKPEYAMVELPEQAKRLNEKTLCTREKKKPSGQSAEEMPLFAADCPQREEKREEETSSPLPPSPDNGKGGVDSLPDRQAVEEEPTLRSERKKPRPQTILQPPVPDDGTDRNYRGMVEELQRRKVPLDDLNAILRMSNFGAIGHPAWKAIYQISLSPGRFRLPGKYILSEIHKSK